MTDSHFDRVAYCGVVEANNLKCGITWRHLKQIGGLLVENRSRHVLPNFRHGYAVHPLQILIDRPTCYPRGDLGRRILRMEVNSHNARRSSEAADRLLRKQASDNWIPRLRLQNVREALIDGDQAQRYVVKLCPSEKLAKAIYRNDRGNASTSCGAGSTIEPTPGRDAIKPWNLSNANARRTVWRLTP